MNSKFRDRIWFVGLLFLTLSLLFISLSINRASTLPPSEKVWLQFGATVAPFIIFSNLLLLFLCLRKSWFIAPIPLISLFFNRRFLFAILAFGVRANRSEGGRELNLLTYNINYFNHTKLMKVSEIAAMAEEHRVDILALQEFEAAELYNIEEIIGKFDYFDYCASYTDDSSSIGMALFSKFPILSSSKVSFADSGNGYMWADLLIDSDTIRVINCHLQTTGFYSNIRSGTMRVLKKAAQNYKVRERQALQIREFIESSPYPLIVSGDFNDVPHSFVYTTICGENLSDSFIKSGRGLGGSYYRSMRLVRIDMILHSSHFNSLSHRVINSNLSDHKPILSRLEYRN